MPSERRRSYRHQPHVFINTGLPPPHQRPITRLRGDPSGLGAKIVLGVIILVIAAIVFVVSRSHWTWSHTEPVKVEPVYKP